MKKDVFSSDSEANASESLEKNILKKYSFGITCEMVCPNIIPCTAVLSARILYKYVVFVYNAPNNIRTLLSRLHKYHASEPSDRVPR